VDIEATSDPISNGYTVGWFNRGEWLKYTVNVATAGTYTIEFRVANGNTASGKVQIQNADGTEILETLNVPSTGSWSTWTTVTVTGGFKTAGLQGIRMVNTLGEFNVNSINFVFQNATIPAVVPVVPSEKVISLKGNNSKYVTFSGADNLIVCSATTQRSTEEFSVVDAGNGLVALKGSNGKYISLNGANNLLYCNASVIGTNEKFILSDLCGAVSLKGYNNLYVSSDNGAITGMPCSRTTAQAWEYFNWTYIRDNDIVTGITDVLAVNGYKVFPNPTQNTINISSISSTLNKRPLIIIYDLSGKAVINSSLTESKKSIDLSSMGKGVYLMRIIEPKKSITFKIIKAN
jgi:hypothetical protein